MFKIFEKTLIVGYQIHKVTENNTMQSCVSEFSKP